jgi:crotonobetainyl-CoA:carnitine CoA-transferase CaiB-like acyl-CoA transferase
MLLRTGTGISIPVIWECKDGDVSYRLFLGHGQAKANVALIEWMESEAIHSDMLSHVDWETLDWEKIGQEFADEFVAKFDSFVRKLTKAELFEGAIARSIQLFPLYTPSDILKFGQLTARDFWVHVEHPHLGTTITYPGAFIKLSETPWKIRRCAPLIGEHNEEIYGKELGLTSEQLITLKQISVI